MCGIAGYSLRPGKSDQTVFPPHTKPDLAEALTAIRHRGPDGSGIFEDADNRIGLGHVRLSIIDLHETGAQPMQNPDNENGMVLSYNGEIYNYLDLRAELEEQGYKFRGTSDTEVLLQLLEVQGLDAVHALNGMFAFAAYDRTAGEVTIVRDAYGVKPLYYTENENGCFFSSEVRGLTAMGVTPEAPAADVVGRYLTFLWNPGTQTPSPNIRTLAPGEAITMKAGRIDRQWQWFRSPTLQPQPVSQDVQKTIVDTATHLRDAVHRQMIADVPVGAFLSGGLDSSAVVAFAREHAPDIKCFTIDPTGGPEEGTPDDLPYARRVADHLGVPLEVVEVDPNAMAQDLEMMVAQLEEPLADPACLNVLYICQLARQQGIKVLLSGSGGDDLFTGYRRHRAVAFDRHFKHLPTAVRRGFSSCSSLLNQKNPLQRRVAKFLSGFALNGDERLINYFAWTARSDILALLSDSARAAVSDVNFTGPMVDYLQEMDEKIDDIDKILALEQRFFLAEHNLIYTDKMSMAASLEVRVPFLDLELVSYAATIPHHLKQRGKEGKWILKKAMEPYLPHDVIYRPKAGFGAPLRHWLRGELREMMQDLLSSESLNRRGIFNPDAVQALIADDVAGRKDASYTILSMMCLELWCRNNLGRTDTPNRKYSANNADAA